MSSDILQASLFYFLQIRVEKKRHHKIPPDVVAIGKKEIAVIKKRRLMKEENIPQLKSILVKPDRSERTTIKCAKNKKTNFTGSNENQKTDGSLKSKKVKVR
uniref:Uncharacterized protein n=1 Tax=Panagrolaimus superbus TaxID=310955 RepID=A0A914YHI5_9BILA